MAVWRPRIFLHFKLEGHVEPLSPPRVVEINREYHPESIKEWLHGKFKEMERQSYMQIRDINIIKVTIKVNHEVFALEIAPDTSVGVFRDGDCVCATIANSLIFDEDTQEFPAKWLQKLLKNTGVTCVPNKGQIILQVTSEMKKNQGLTKDDV